MKTYLRHKAIIYITPQFLRNLADQAEEKWARERIVVCDQELWKLEKREAA